MVRTNERVAIGLAAAALVAASLVLRAYGTLHDPLWLDEAYSAYAADKSFAFLWHVVPRYETHPPLYYSLLRLWTLAFGDSLLAMRALSIVCGLATLPVVVLAGREIARAAKWPASGRRLAAITLLALVAMAPPLVDMARQVRPYPVLILAYAAALLAILRIGRRVAAGEPVAGRAFALYLVMLATTAWLHTLGPLFAAALALGLAAVVVRRSLTRADWLWLIGGHLLVALAYVPALLIALDQAPTWIQSTWLTFSLDAIHWRLAILYGAPGTLGMTATLVMLGLGAVALERAGETRRIFAALGVTMGLPVAAAIAISLLVAPVFIMRTMTPVAVPSLLLIAAGVIALRGPWRWIGIAAAVLLLSQMLAMDLSLVRAPPEQNWYAAIRWLRARYRPGDLILAYPNEGALPFDRATRDLGLRLPIRPIPMAVPALGVGGWNPTGSRGVVSLPPARLQAFANAPAVRAAPTVWLLRLGPWAYDKGDVFLRELAVGRRPVARIISSFPHQPIDLVGLRLAPSAPRGARAGAAAAR